MLEKPVVTGFSRATKPTRTGPSRFSCSCSKLGASCNRLPILWLKNRTKPDLKTLCECWHSRQSPHVSSTWPSPVSCVSSQQLCRVSPPCLCPSFLLLPSLHLSYASLHLTPLSAVAWGQYPLLSPSSWMSHT
ncbi:hypothetical protein L208DRAFT_933182 [Tricholoma matsutake]|nr:hypothetical protein L208DRAFT_933182 [Tricholoma matsutake 945]